MRLTHANRVVYPSQGVTKRDLALFYESIADRILPHLAGRPTSLVRCPEGVDKECFYQKHVGLGVPEDIRRVKIREKTKVGDYLVVDTLPALISLVQIGILEIHTWNSVVDQLERPDRVVFDLDPAPDVPWPRVVAAARLVRKRLEALGLESFVKTTGGKGLHVVVPLASGITWEQGADFSRAVAESLAREEPRGFIAQMSKAARTGKIFIDYFRNARGATSVAAYSTRAKPEAPVSVPLGLGRAVAAAHVRSLHRRQSPAPSRRTPQGSLGALLDRPSGAARRADRRPPMALEAAGRSARRIHMPTRPLWSGLIAFGLVTSPIALHRASGDTRPRFRTLHAKDKSPVKFERVCQREGHAVTFSDLVKGYGLGILRVLLIIRLPERRKSRTTRWISAPRMRTGYRLPW